MIKKVALNYELNAFEPHISEEAMDAHYNAHYTTYVNNTNNLLNEEDERTLPEIVMESYRDQNIKLFNNSAQAWNHEIFWNCLGGQSLDINSKLYSAIVD